MHLIWEHHLNHFYRTSVFSQSFHLRVQLMPDFLSCLPSSLVWGPSPAPWQRLPLLRRSPPLVTDMEEGAGPLDLAASCLSVPLSLLPGPISDPVLLNPPQGHGNLFGSPTVPWGCCRSVDPPAFSSLGILVCWVQNQVCLTMSLDFITLSFPLTRQLLGWKRPQVCYCSSEWCVWS